MAETIKQSRTVLARKLALFDLIATKRAGTAAEAVVQIVFASSLLDILRDSDDEDERRNVERQASRLLSSSLAVLVRETGINPAEYGLHHYTADCDFAGTFWPEALGQ